MAQARILIVDDNELILQLLQTIFVSAGFAPRLARDGVAALAAAVAEPPDVILLDVHLPLLNGFQVLERLRAEAATHDRTVVMTSTDEQAIGGPLALAHAAQAYVMKPFSPAALVWTVRDALAAAYVNRIAS